MDRIKRYSEFNKFADRASEAFAAFCSEGQNSKLFEKSHSFYAIKGGSMGGIDKRIVEVFFGSRAIDQVDMFVPQGSGLPARSRKTLSERGANLLYERTDAGTVLCTLRPAVTEHLQQVEDAIYLDWIADPSVLNRERKVRAHWRALVSYMECTCIDGTPSLIDRLRVGWLRFSHRLIKDGRQSSTRLNQAVLQIVKFTLTIGLSGFLLTLLGSLNSSKGTERADAVRDKLAVETAEMRGEIVSDRDRIKALEGQVEAYRNQLAAMTASVDALKVDAAKKSEGRSLAAHKLSSGAHSQSK